MIAVLLPLLCAKGNGSKTTTWVFLRLTLTSVCLLFHVYTDSEILENRNTIGRHYDRPVQVSANDNNGS
jgi:hypothetical protein